MKVKSSVLDRSVRCASGDDRPLDTRSWCSGELGLERDLGTWLGFKATWPVRPDKDCAERREKKALGAWIFGRREVKGDMGVGGQPGEAECWEPRDKVPCQRRTTDLGKTEVSGNLDKSSAVEWGRKPTWRSAGEWK